MSVRRGKFHTSSNKSWFKGRLKLIKEERSKWQRKIKQLENKR